MIGAALNLNLLLSFSSEAPLLGTFFFFKYSDNDENLLFAH